jgi:hypothetical protein
MMGSKSKTKTTKNALTNSQNHISLEPPYRRRERSVIAKGGKRYSFLIIRAVFSACGTLFIINIYASVWLLGRKGRILVLVGLLYGHIKQGRLMQIKKQLIQTLVAWGALLVFMMVFRPQNIPVLLLVVPFVLLFVALMSLWGLVVPVLRRITGRRGYAGSRRLKVTVCGSIVLLLVLQSLGQLTLRDVGTIVAIAVLGYVYIGRSRSVISNR